MTDAMEEAIHKAAALWASELLRGDKERFRIALENSLKAALGPALELTLRTDWDPDEILWTALEAAGIDMPAMPINTCRDTLPRKSVMHIQPGRIEVRWGRGGAWEFIEVGNGADQQRTAE